MRGRSHRGLLRQGGEAPSQPRIGNREANQAERASRNTFSDLFGKILRINKDGTIPTKNPFYLTTSGNNRAIWALGLRNPFKFAVKPGKGTIFINDVGQDAWEEIDEALPGANYGWGFPTSPPYYEGFIASPDSSLQNYNNPILYYGHDGDPTTTGCSITGGVFYDPATLQYPAEEYEGDYFFADFCSGWIRRRSVDPSTEGVNISTFASGIERPVDLEVSKEGELYYLSRGNSSTPGSVGKIWYTGNP